MTTLHCGKEGSPAERECKTRQCRKRTLHNEISILRKAIKGQDALSGPKMMFGSDWEMTIFHCLEGLLSGIRILGFLCGVRTR